MSTDARAKELVDLGDRLFHVKRPLDDLCQEIAENCYPERADFTSQRNIGDDFAAHLNDSYPVIARRELCNSFSAILRPRDKHWFASTTFDDRLDNDPANARFLEYITSQVRTGIYDPRTEFVAATKTADHDFGTFGNSILSVEESTDRKHLFYRAHHFRDCAWLENEIGKVDHLHRKDKMTARAMRRKFGNANVHEAIRKACEEEPHKEFSMRVVVMPADEYDYIVGSKGGEKRKGKKLPFVICYVDADNCKVMREGGLVDFMYVVSRWHRISGFQYAFSPAAMTALPDSRLVQDLTLLILEAGEKSVYPPMLARKEAVQQDNVRAGSLTWAHLDADQKLEEAMRALPISADMKVGFGLLERVQGMIDRAWFLDKLKLPDPASGDMTAYEVARRIEDHVRNLLPLFEPMELECNNQVLDRSFSRLANMKKFDWSLQPQSLHHTDVFWAFKNPMQEASSRILVSQGMEVMQIIKAAQEFGLQVSPVKSDIVVKDMIRGTSAPATWRKTQEEEEAEAKEAAVRAKIEGAAREIAAAGQIAEQVGKGAQQMQEAGMAPLPAHRQVEAGLPPPVLDKRKVTPALPTPALPFDPYQAAA